MPEVNADCLVLPDFDGDDLLSLMNVLYGGKYELRQEVWANQKIDNELGLSQATLGLGLDYVKLILSALRVIT